MKASDVRSKTPDELADELAALKKEQFNLRFQRATGQLENTSRVREIRRTIARIKTMQNAQRQKATGQLEKTARVKQVRRDIARIKTIAAEKAAGKQA